MKCCFGMSDREGENYDYQVLVCRFKAQCGRVYFGRSIIECSVGKGVTPTLWADTRQAAAVSLFSRFSLVSLLFERHPVLHEQAASAWPIGHIIKKNIKKKKKNGCCK